MTCARRMPDYPSGGQRYFPNVLTVVVLKFEWNLEQH
jgi:hypothetical protein